MIKNLIKKGSISLCSLILAGSSACTHDIKLVSAPKSLPQIEYEQNPSIPHKEVEFKLARHCSITGFEDAAVLTNKGKIIDVGKDAGNIIYKGEIATRAIYVDTKLMINLAKENTELTLYHCHPQFSPSEPTYPIPSATDAMSAMKLFYELSIINPEIKLNFKVVNEGIKDSVNVTQYYIKLNDQDMIRKFARSTRVAKESDVSAELLKFNERLFDIFVQTAGELYKVTSIYDSDNQSNNGINDLVYTKMANKVPEPIAITNSILESISKNSSFDVTVYTTTK